MNPLIKIFGMFAAASLFLSSCGTLSVQTEADEGAVQNADYEWMLGKPLTDEFLSNFIFSNNCSNANQFLLCETAGMALWMESNRVENVYLYLNNTQGFDPYSGKLPFGLKFYDTMGAVEYKLNRQGIGNAGRPDTGATPDRMHYRATYSQAGMTIIYNYPAPDEGATINTIVITNKKQPR